MSAYSRDFGGIVRELKTPAVVSLPVGIDIPDVTPVQVVALWDTGATYTVIGDKVIEALKLKPFDHMDAYGVSGQYKTPVFLVDLLLPNRMMISNLCVSRGDLVAADMLIGMDVISLGDMGVSNFGKTLFSFRIPSEGEVRVG